MTLPEDRLKCVREVHLEVERMCGELTQVDSKVYRVPVKEDNNQVHVLECFGVNIITKQATLPDAKTYEALCKKFDIPPDKVRGTRRIDLMISMRESHLLPVKDRTLGKLTLYQSQFGATFWGSYQKMSIGSHLKTFKSTAQVLPIINTMTLKVSTVINRTAMRVLY